MSRMRTRSGSGGPSVLGMERSEGAVVTRDAFCIIGTADCKFACNPAGLRTRRTCPSPLIVAPAKSEHPCRNTPKGLITVDSCPSSWLNDYNPIVLASRIIGLKGQDFS